MIRMIKGTYGHVVDGVVEAKTKDSAPFSLSKKREDELVAAGVAEKVEGSTYEDMTMAELREIATSRGIDTAAVKSKRKMIALLEAKE